MGAMEIIGLSPLLARTSGDPAISIGLIDGPVYLDHPDLSGGRIQEVSPGGASVCSRASSAACVHGTLVAGVLMARRDSGTPGICPGCRLLIRPIFDEALGLKDQLPSATPATLAAAIRDAVDAGARILNLSAAVAHPSSRGERQVEESLTYAARREVIVIAAAGNQGTLASSAITRHAAVIPVVGCDDQGRPTQESNLGSSIGRRGLRAPGKSVTSLATDGGVRTFDGTSAAAPFVTGAIALLWSEFPNATAREIQAAVLLSARGPRNAIVPPLLDAWAAFHHLAGTHESVLCETGAAQAS